MSTGTPLFVFALIALALVATTVGATVIRLRRDPSLPLGPGRIVGTTWWVSLGYGAVVVVTTAIGVARALASRTVEVVVPIEDYWPTLPPGTVVDHGDGAVMESAAMSQADLVVSGLSQSTRALIAGGEAVGGLTVLSVVAVVALVCRSLRRRTPFTPVLERACGAVALSVAIGGSLAQLLHITGANRAGFEALSWASVDQDCGNSRCPDPSSLLPVAHGSGTFELWPLGVALALGVIAVVLRTGQSLARDTEGLV